VEKLKRDISVYRSSSNHSNLTPSHTPESTLRLWAFVGMYSINLITSGDNCYVLGERWCRIDAIIHSHGHYYRSYTFNGAFIIYQYVPRCKIEERDRIVITMVRYLIIYLVIYLCTKPVNIVTCHKIILMFVFLSRLF
jgi:hypothetical protein